MPYVDLIPSVMPISLTSLANGATYRSEAFNVGDKMEIGIVIKASQALSVRVAYGASSDTAATAGTGTSASLPFVTSATSFASSAGSTEAGTYHSIAIPPSARKAQLVIANSSGSTANSITIDAALRRQAYPSGGGITNIVDAADWPAGVSITELGYIGGLTSDAQTQINGKAASSHTHAASDIASGTVATARLGSGTADNTTFLRGDQTWAAPSATVTAAYCVLQKSAFQTVSAVTWTDITFDEEVADTNGWHSTFSNTARVTVDAAGKYLVISPWMLRPASNNPVLFALAKNGIRLSNMEQYHNIQSSGVINGGQFSWVVDLAANDYITQQIYCAAETYVYGSDARGDESSHRLIVIRLGD